MGGLTVRAQIAKKLPNESLIYFGDGLNVPYGGRPRSEIIDFAGRAVEILLENGSKMVVVACNAATGAAIEALRARFSNVPIVGMEPAVKPAALTTRTGVIGVLATRAALCGELYLKTAAQFRETVRIVEAVGEGFVELVENERVNSDEAFEVVGKVLEPMLEQGVDRIVLGCTHYPYLEPVMREIIGDRNVEIIDSAPAVARRVDNLLTINELRASEENVPRYEFLSFAGPEYVERLRKISRL